MGTYAEQVTSEEMKKALVAQGVTIRKEDNTSIYITVKGEDFIMDKKDLGIKITIEDEDD